MKNITSTALQSTDKKTKLKANFLKEKKKREGNYGNEEFETY